MKPKIFITRMIPTKIIKKLEEFCEISIWPEEEMVVPQNILEKEIVDVDNRFRFLSQNLKMQAKMYSNLYCLLYLSWQLK